MNFETQHDAERNLLLALLGRRKPARDRAAMLSLLRQVNWEVFLEIVSEDLYPYLAFGLEPYIDSLEAAPDWEKLFRARRRTAVHNLRLRHELGKILDALRQSGI